MPERDGYIPGVPCWIDTSQPDPEAALPFYRGLFGWEFEDVMPGGSDGAYLIGRIRGGDVAAVSSIPEGAPPMAMWNTYVWVDNADETAARARAAGGAVIMEPFDVLDAGRMAVLADPEGAVFCAWQAKNHKGAQVVNEHGSLNFNGLATRDPEAAKAFYGAVFGWQTLAMQRWCHVDASRLRRSPRGEHSWPSRPDGADGCARRLHRRRRRARADRPRRLRDAGVLERHLRRRRRRRHSSEGTASSVALSSPDPSMLRGSGEQ